MAQGTTVPGTVAAVNDTGFKLDGDSDWINYGRYFDGPRPSKGDQILVTYTVSGDRRYVTEWQHAGASNGRGTTPANGNGAAITPRDQLMARMSALKSATTLAQGKDGITSADVLQVADRYLEWLLAS